MIHNNKIRINSINMFINKNQGDEILDLDVIKENFRLDEGENNFYRLSMFRKIVIGGDTVNENYNRPPIGPIKDGLICQYCSSIGINDHDNYCDFPDDSSLYLTIKGFKQNILSDIKYNGELQELKDKILDKSVSVNDINEILIIPEDETKTVEDILKEDDIQTSIRYNDIYKKRGPKKLAYKTSTTQFLNNIIIYHELDDVKTSIRISKNGLINLINSPKDKEKLDLLIKELLLRINETGGVLSGEEYVYDAENSFIHSITGQFSIELEGDENIDFEELNNLISPFDLNGNIIETDYTQVSKTTLGDNIIFLDGLKLIEWEYSLGRLTRNEVMSKEYIKFVAIVAPGIKLTGIINKGGTFMLTLSACNEKLIRMRLCEPKREDIDPKFLINTYNVFKKLFDKENSILIRKSLTNIQQGSLKNFNTISGYAPPVRETRTRTIGGIQYQEEIRPKPYSWSGKCSDPNYQYLNPVGAKGKDNLWYPECQGKTKKSIEQYKKYLIHGFPINVKEGEELNIFNRQDKGSGIFLEGSNLPGSNVDITIGNDIKNVTIVKKLDKKLNRYEAIDSNGEKYIINGTNFIRESRIFPGLKDLDKKKLINCIRNSLKKNGNTIDLEGNVIKDFISEMNEKFIKQNRDIFLKKHSPIKNKIFTLNSYKDFIKDEFLLVNIPLDSYCFYLVISPDGIFYINYYNNSLNSDISIISDNNIIFYGFLKINDIEFKKEFHVIDIVYYNKDLTGLNFEERYNLIIEIQDKLLNQITEEIFIFPEFLDDIILASHEIIQNNVNKKLLFVNKNSFEKILYDKSDMFDDILELQVLSINREIVKFGHEGKEFDEPLDFLSNFPFEKRKVPDTVNEYYNVKINRDVDGAIAPVRKLSILNKKVSSEYKFEEVNEKLLVKFFPVNDNFFEYDDVWIFNNIKLKGSSLLNII